MTRDRHSRVKDLFIAVHELPPGERAAFLACACTDGAVRHEVEELLAVHDDLPADDVPGCDAAVPEARGYQVVGKLGEGGMGEVWEAEQAEPVRRRVALKVIRWGMDTREVLARFEAERQALGMMSHDAVARVFEAGTTGDGRPFITMELVDGLPITDYCDLHRLGVAERVALLVGVCQGVQHAHQKGVIHRDIKPSNILVSLQDGRAAPKIIDFGVAKAISRPLIEKTVATRLGQWIGTPDYMSPEQAGETGVDVDTRTDVYALGVVLYELLAGVRPFDSAALRAADAGEVRRSIRELEPPLPSLRVSTLGDDAEVAAARRRTTRDRLVRELRGDLDWIAMKALAQDRARRYGSPAELAADLRRHLDNEPVTAGPPGVWYRMSKLIRRHRVAVSAAALVVVAVLAGLVTASVGLVRARRAERVASRQVELLIGMIETLDPGGSSGGSLQVREVLGRAAERIEDELGDQPLVQARLKSSMARILLNLGSYDEARPLLEEALEVRRRLLGADHHEVAVSLRVLGELYGIVGSFDDARRLLEEALAIDRVVFGPEHLESASTLDELAFTLWRMGRYEEAIEPFEHALAIRLRALGPDHQLVADTLYRRALVFRETGDLQRARTDLERAMTIRRSEFGTTDTMYAWMVENYGNVLAQMGERAEARRHLERALEIQERIFGRFHFSVAEPLLALGGIDLDDGNPELARQHFERARSVLLKLMGPDHHYLAFSLDGLGRVAVVEGDLEDARRLFEQGLELRQRALGGDHPHVAMSLLSLGDVTRRSGDLDASLAFFERRLAILEDARAPDSVDVARARVDVAAMMARGGDRDGAQEPYDLGIGTTVAALERGRGDPGRAYYNLACIAALVGRPEDALGFLRRALDHGFVTDHVHRDPDLDALRGDPDFEQVAETMGRRRREQARDGPSSAGAGPR